MPTLRKPITCLHGSLHFDCSQGTTASAHRLGFGPHGYAIRSGTLWPTVIQILMTLIWYIMQSIRLSLSTGRAQPYHIGECAPVSTAISQAIAGSRLDARLTEQPTQNYAIAGYCCIYIYVSGYTFLLTADCTQSDQENRTLGTLEKAVIHANCC